MEEKCVWMGAPGLKLLAWLRGSARSHFLDCFQQLELDWEGPEQSGCRRKLLLKNPFLMRWQIHDSRHLYSSFASDDCDDDY